jgi:hypothetical protein
MRLFTYRYWHPVYHQFLVLDCAAVDANAALCSAVRFIARENRRLKKIKATLRCQIPSHPSFLRAEG